MGSEMHAVKPISEVKSKYQQSQNCLPAPTMGFQVPECLSNTQVNPIYTVG